ncbi:MAG TPA: hypothetical protein VJU52_12515 [Flavobacterium sp.]|nr:hypothetical protein [Flavobacterium sp.]
MKNTIKTIILFFAFFIGVGTYAVSAQNPPAHAKAHGVKKKYRYYPEANVYFDPIGKRYTYLNGGRWVSGATLPNTIRLIGAFNDFDFDGDDPWKENSNHKEKYKPVKQTKPVKTSDVKKVEKTVNSYDSKSSKGGGKKK